MGHPQARLQMMRSTKLGLVSLLLVGIFVPLTILPEPIGFSCCVIACVLASLAARDGSRWWLAVPAVIACVTVLGLYVAIHSY
jgi:uncharacterized membrane protein YccC